MIVIAPPPTRFISPLNARPMILPLDHLPTPSHRLHVLFSLLSGLILAGCGQPDPSLARNDTPTELMRVAVPDWAAEGKKAIRLILTSDDKNEPGGYYALAPELVIRQDESHLTLIVSGEPTTEAGEPNAGHASPGAIGAYWFEKQGNAWRKVAESAHFVNEGYFGKPGDLRAIDLGGQMMALSVENGSCWQGSCLRAQTIYTLNGNRLQQAFSDVIAGDTLGSSANCSDLLARKDGEVMRATAEQFSIAGSCSDITGKTTIQPGKNGPGQLVVEFTGVIGSAEEVQDEAAPTADNSDGGETEAEAEITYRISIRQIHQKQVYHFRDGRFVLIKGKNPIPPI